MKTFITFFGIAMFFLGGFYVTWYSKQFPDADTVTIVSNASRDPAAIKKNYDFSHLEGSALNYAAKQRLLDGVKLVQDNKDIGVELGHFVIRGEDGEKAFACQRYSKVVMAFEGDGVAVGGELPKMEVEGTCEISSDINSIAAVWIPVSKILGEPVADGEFDYREGHPAKLKFSNVSDQWPKTWMLRSVKLVDPTGQNGEVAIPPAELNSIMKKSFVLNF
jgi:hypothetical protein